MLAGVKINARCSTVLFARLAMCVCVCVCVHEECVRMRTRYETVVNKVEFLLSWKCIFWNFPRRILFIYLFIYLENIYFQIFQEYCDTNFIYLFIYLFIFIVYVCKLSPTSQMIIFYLFFRSSNLFADGKFRSNGM